MKLYSFRQYTRQMLLYKCILKVSCSVKVAILDLFIPTLEKHNRLKQKYCKLYHLNQHTCQMTYKLCHNFCAAILEQLLVAGKYWWNFFISINMSYDRQILSLSRQNAICQFLYRAMLAIFDLLIVHISRFVL